MNKISVIVPVYNGEEYLARCLNSLVNQSFRGLEVLAIDDGSRDKSYDIIRSFEKRYPDTLRAFTHSNRGVAKTRDRGMALASGEYIMFVDQDDYIDSDYCERLYSAAQTGDFDIVISGFKRPGSGGRIINKNVTLTESPYAKYICPGVFPKLHRASFLKKYQIKAFHTVYGEDIGFVLHEYAVTNKIKIVENYAGYNWFYNQASVSNTLHKQLLTVLPMHLIMLNKIKSYDTKTPEHEYYTLQTVVAYLLWAGRTASKKDFLVAYTQVCDWLYSNYPNLRKNKYIHFGPPGAPPLNRIAISAFMLIDKLHCMRLFALIYCRG